MYVKHDGRVFPCCQSYMLDGAPMAICEKSRWRRFSTRTKCGGCGGPHAQGRAGEIDMCARCCTPIPHPLLVAGSLLVHGKWVRRAMPVVERLIYSRKLPRTLLSQTRGELVQIEDREGAARDSAL